MTKSHVTLDDIADWGNLVAAAERAARGKRFRPAAVGFLAALDANLAAMRTGILDGTVPVGEMTAFHIRDPKPRTIHAPCFRERVLHHAVMARVGPVLDRGLVDDSFACRVGKGTLAAVRRAQHHVRRFPWYAKMDVRGYFASIDHGILTAHLARRFRRPVLGLIGRMIDSHHAAPGKGLPIGSLVSQALANAYLNPLDRFLLETRRACGFVRYMDDFLVWDTSKERATGHVRAVREFLGERLALTLKDPPQVNRSDHGVTVCGYRVHAGALLLAKSRRKRFRAARAYWDKQFAAGRIDDLERQRGMDSALSIIAHADTRAWRKRQFGIPDARSEDGE
ncbi:MAG TPA: reverse transcriptase/maturase family protein [Urbifossiella sp.]|jgi:hypothetical protein|nr:reverse transcriptase/maturase family protein [Urbifossiella sp.]